MYDTGIQTLLCTTFTVLLGEASMLLLGVVLFSLMRDRGAAFRLASALLVASSTVGLLKAATRVPRPPSSEWLVNAYGYSFPSGHAAGAAVLALFLTDLWRLKGMIIGLPLAACVSLSRLVLGVHWPTDIVGGAILGALTYLAISKLYHRIGKLNVIILSGLYSTIASVLALVLDESNPLVWVLATTSTGFTLGLILLSAAGMADKLERTTSITNGLAVVVAVVLLWGIVLLSILNGSFAPESLLSSFLAGLVIVLARAAVVKQ